MEADHESLIAQFCGVTGCGPATAQAALATTNWNIDQAVGIFLAAQDQPSDDMADDDELEEPQVATQPSSSSRAPAGGASSSRTVRGAPNQSKLRTLRDLQGSGSAGNDDDESGDEEQDFFAGGEKSGLAVRDPNKPQDHFNNIISQAKQNRERPGEEEGPVRSSNFAGRAQTLGGDDAPSQVIGDPEEPAAPSRLARVERTLHLWQDGFSVDDGPLYRFDDPANAPTLALINQGRAPLALLGVQPGQEVDLNLNPHKDEKYVAPKKAFNPFGGSGQRLGSPTPGPSGSADPTTHTGPSAAFGTGSGSGAGAAAAAAAAGAGSATSSTPTDAIVVNDTDPVINIRIQLSNGTRLPARFNTTHHVSDVHTVVERSNTVAAGQRFVLMTTFPSRELASQDALGDIPELKKGGVVVVKHT